MKTHHSVWNYDMAKRNNTHITPKPVDLLENIIRHTTDENDILLDCFAGSGSLALACLSTKRKCILIEKEEKYCDYIKSILQNPCIDISLEEKEEEQNKESTCVNVESTTEVTSVKEIKPKKKVVRKKKLLIIEDDTTTPDVV